MQDFDRRLDEHMTSDEKLFSRIADDLEKIKDNHLAHIQAAVELVQLDVAKTKNDMSWVKRLVFAVSGACITGIGTLIFKQLL